MIKNYSDTDEEVLDEINIDEILKRSYSLILWNDDVNTFDNVIATLMEVCKHSLEQAEQCAMLVHLKGKCSVKNGDFEKLKDMCDKIQSRGITATVEEN